MSLIETLDRLPPAAADYCRDLVDEHWSEAAWLYERRETLHFQGALVGLDSWERTEARAAAHVEALVAGGRWVREGCPEYATTDEVGELHAAIRVLVRARAYESLSGLLESIEWERPGRARAVRDAIAWDASSSWAEPIGALLNHDTTPELALAPLVAAASIRRWPDLGATLVGLLERRVAGLESIVDACARLGVEDALPCLHEFVDGEDPVLRHHAARAALCFETHRMGAYLAQVARTEDWAALPLAMSAGPEARSILEALAEARPDAECMLALGLLGCPESIEFLLEVLDDETLAPSAAEALYLLTGAPLHESVSVAFDDDDDDEKLPCARLPHDRARWDAWLQEHGGGLSREPSVRLRLGVPFDPLVVLEELSRTTSSPMLRTCMVDELAIRYGLVSWYSPRMLVTDQRAALTRMKLEIEEEPSCVVGAWYLAGQPVSRPTIRRARR